MIGLTFKSKLNIFLMFLGKLTEEDIMQFKRIFGIVLDSVGTGAAADASKFDDEGSDTLGHIEARLMKVI